MRNAGNLAITRYSIAALLVWFLVGCATQLAPAYDKSVVDELNATNVEAMTIFAAAAGGTKPDTFKAREEKYNTTIGKLDALTILAGARPIPGSKTTETINRFLVKRGHGGLLEDEATPPSAHAIERVARTVEKMRDTDKVQGLTKTEVEVFKGQAVTYLDQAITYENFLKR